MSGPGASGTTIWTVPTRWHPSAGMSPRHRQVRLPPVQSSARGDLGVVDLGAEVAHHVHVERERLAGGELLGEAVGDHDHRPARLAERVVGGLRGPVVAEHRPGDRRVPVGEAELGEAAGRSVLDAAQRLDVPAHDHGLVRLRGGPPLVEGRVVGGRHVPVEERLAAARGCGRAAPSRGRAIARARRSRRSSGTACAPNSVTKRAMRGSARRKPGKSRSWPWYQPK